MANGILVATPVNGNRQEFNLFSSRAELFRLDRVKENRWKPGDFGAKFAPITRKFEEIFITTAQRVALEERKTLLQVARLLTLAGLENILRLLVIITPPILTPTIVTPPLVTPILTPAVT